MRWSARVREARMWTWYTFRAHSNCRRRRPESRGASNVSLRTKAREFAMQMLFQWDMSQQDFAKLEAKFWRSAKAADRTRAFANQLFEGAAKEVGALDEMIAKHCEHWRFERLAAVERGVFRVGNYEMGAGGTPPKGVLEEGGGVTEEI